MSNYSEEDLLKLIDQKLSECTGLPEVCKMIQNETGRTRIAARVKEILLTDSITSIDAALSHIEAQMTFEE